MKIVLHIERLVLDGLPVASTRRVAVGAAVERELTRLLASGGLGAHLAHGGALPRIAAPQIRFARRDRADAMGVRIARAIYGGIGGGK
jgi:hypothetical protein